MIGGPKGFQSVSMQYRGPLKWFDGIEGYFALLKKDDRGCGPRHASLEGVIAYGSIVTKEA